MSAPDPVLHRERQRKAAELVVTTQHGSVNMLRRQLVIPQDHARELMLDLQEQGFVGHQHPDSGRSRDVLVPFAGMADLMVKIDAAFPVITTAAAPWCRDCSELNLTPCKGPCS